MDFTISGRETRRGGGRGLLGERDARQDRRQTDAAAREPRLEQLASLRQSAGDGPHLPAQLLGGFHLAHAAQATEDERQLELFGESIEFFVKDALQLIPRRIAPGRGSHGRVLGFAFPLLAAG